MKEVKQVNMPNKCPKGQAKPKDWRAFEELVLRMQGFLANRDFGVSVQLKSPDKIFDINSGVPINVDAAIRYSNSSGTFLTVIECRKWRKNQDRPWIDALRSRKLSLNADRMIAVSSKGFSPYALIQAGTYGIELCRIEEITDSILEHWFAVPEYKHPRCEWHPLRIEMLDEGGNSIDLHPDLVEKVESCPLDAEILADKTVNRPLTLRELGNIALNKVLFPEDKPFVEHNGEATVVFECTAHELYVAACSGDLKVQKINLDVFIHSYWETNPMLVKEVKQMLSVDSGKKDNAILQEHIEAIPFELSEIGSNIGVRQADLSSFTHCRIVAVPYDKGIRYELQLLGHKGPNDKVKP